MYKLITILSELKLYPARKGNLPHQYYEDDDVKEYLKKIISLMNKENYEYVIIVTGLDWMHAYRKGTYKKENNKFIFYPTENYHQYSLFGEIRNLLYMLANHLKYFVDKEKIIESNVIVVDKNGNIYINGRADHIYHGGLNKKKINEIKLINQNQFPQLVSDLNQLLWNNSYKISHIAHESYSKLRDELYKKLMKINFKSHKRGIYSLESIKLYPKDILKWFYNEQLKIKKEYFLNEINLVSSKSFPKNVAWVYKINNEKERDNILKILDSKGFSWGDGRFNINYYNYILNVYPFHIFYDNDGLGLLYLKNSISDNVNNYIDGHLKLNF